MRHTAPRLLTLVALVLAGCSAVGPDYQRPATTAPATWKTEAGWQTAEPRDEQPKGPWWTQFGDSTLNQLETQALAQNQSLAIAQSRLDQARAQTAIAVGALLPRVGLQAGSSRFRTSADRPLNAYTVPNQSVVQNDFNGGINVSYEVDLSGRVRRQIESARASEAQSGADFENTRLMLTAQLAASYFSLRELDRETAVLRATIAAQRAALAFVNDRHELGYASALDMAQQQATLAGIEAQLQTLIDQRSHFEHALATLTGVDAPSFTLAPVPSKPLPPSPAISLLQPATLLERRPDIASSERAMAAANAQIGIARSAYYPTLTLAGLLGGDSNLLPKLFSLPSLLWSVGANATQTLFDAGRTDASVAAAKASFVQAEANYRQTVLNAFQEVQDSLSTRATMAQAASDLDRAARSSAQALEITEVRYHGGAANRLELVLAQQNLLAYQRQQVQNQGQQLLAAVQLVKALGGGWQAPVLAESVRNF